MLIHFKILLIKYLLIKLYNKNKITNHEKTMETNTPDRAIFIN